MQWSGMLHFPSVMLSYWGIMVMLVIITLSMLPQTLVKATQGMTHITVSSLAGMLLGMTFGYAPMIIGAFVGAVAGAVFFSRTPGGAGLKFPSSRFVQYFCAKGLPAVIVVCLFGIAIEVAVLQHFYQPEQRKKMKKLLGVIAIFTILATSLSMSVFAADKEKFKPEKIDMDSVRAHVTDPASPYFYKRLWRKFESNDTNMSMQEYRHLYYGYVFQEDYNPYRMSEFANKIQPLYYKQTHTPAECDTIIKYAELSLADNPFDLNQMKFFIYALKEKKKFARASIWQYRLNHLVEAILSTGTGLKKDNPWVVISPVHEYNIVNFMGLIATDHQELENNIDYIIVKPVDKKTPEGFYFDVSNVLKVYNMKFKE